MLSLTRRQAFEAPLLDGCNSSSSGEQVAKALGEKPIQYGATGNAVDRDGIVEYEARKITFEDPTVMYRPLDRFRFEK